MNFIDTVKSVPITDFAERLGYTLVPHGSRYYSLKEHDSVMISVEKNAFWRNSCYYKGAKAHSGSVIDFAMEFCGFIQVKDAVDCIASLYGIERDKVTKPIPALKVAPVEAKKREAGCVELPKKDAHSRNVYAYLCKTRAIASSVIQFFMHNDMLYQDQFKNCVFHTGTTFGCVRGTSTYKRFVRDLEGCDYDECFFFRGNPDADVLVVTEAVIDAMSIMTQFENEGKDFKNYAYLAMTGTNKLHSVFHHVEKAEAEGKPFRKVLIATDNDKYGEQAAENIAAGLEEYGVESERYAAPTGKDWNEHIVNQSAQTAGKQSK